MGFPRRRQFAHLQLLNITTGARRTVIPADANKERSLERLVMELDDPSTTDWGMIFELSDTGAANHRIVGRTQKVAAADTNNHIVDMTSDSMPGSAANDDGRGHIQDSDSAGNVDNTHISLKDLHIPAGAELTVIRIGGDNDVDADIVASGIEEVVS